VFVSKKEYTELTNTFNEILGGTKNTAGTVLYAQKKIEELTTKQVDLFISRDQMEETINTLNKVTKNTSDLLKIETKNVRALRERAEELCILAAAAQPKLEFDILLQKV